MQSDEVSTGQAAQIRIDVLAAADLQDHLMTAGNDLDRLQTLLSDACDTLQEAFYRTNDDIQSIRAGDLSGQAGPALFERIAEHLGLAVTALQFHDMASQLIAHTHRRLRNCADRLARDAFPPEDDETMIEELPLRPNPVTQAEMDAGSVTLF